MAVLDSIKNTINSIGNKNNTTSSNATSSNATQKKNETGILEQISIRAKGIFCRKVIDSKSKSKQKNTKTKAIDTQ